MDTTLKQPTYTPPRKSRAVPITLGALLATFGALIAAAAAAVLIQGGTDGTIESDRGPISTPTAALVSGTATIDDTAEIAEVIGDTEVHVSADRAIGERPVFVGIGPADAVDRYLKGAPVERVDDLEVEPLALSTTTRPGSRKPEPPVRQDFWVAKSTGPGEASIDWEVRDGDYKLVVMNADGSRGVEADAMFGVDIPFLPALALGVLIVGGIAVIAGTAVVARRPGRA
jgi:hypothetical protein